MADRGYPKDLKCKSQCIFSRLNRFYLMLYQISCLSQKSVALNGRILSCSKMAVFQFSFSHCICSAHLYSATHGAQHVDILNTFLCEIICFGYTQFSLRDIKQGDARCTVCPANAPFQLHKQP